MQTVSSTQDEDFDTINPRAIWEAEKRLFFLPLISLDLKVEAANYLVRNRLNLSLPYIDEACDEYATEKYDGDDIRIPFLYEEQWHSSWVQDVRVFWNRIEYLIENPTVAKHEAFRMSCTSSDPFEKKTLYKYGFGSDIPVEALLPKEDIPAVNHIYNANSATGVVFLHDTDSELYSLSISNTHSVIIKSGYKEKGLNFINEKAVGPDTSLKINFLNGYKVSSKVLDFMIRHVEEQDDSLFFDIEDDNPIAKKGKLGITGSGNPKDKMAFVGLMRESVCRFNPEEFDLVIGRFSQNKWINQFLQD